MEKSLSQLLSEAAIINRTYPPLPGICSAVVCLNISGKPAKADEHIVSLGYCKSTKFTKIDGDLLCAVCWTPQKAISTAVDEQTVLRVKKITDQMSIQDLTALITLLQENRDLHSFECYDKIQSLFVDNDLPLEIRESVIALTGERLLSEETIPSPITKLRQYVQKQGWSIFSDKEVPSGVQIRVNDRTTIVTITFYETGTILVQGGNNSLKNHLQQWVTQFRE